MPKSHKPGHRLALAIVAALLGGEVAASDWQAAYRKGDAVQLKITDTLWQECTVSENAPGGLLRVMCKEYIEPRPGTYSRAGGVYIAYGKDELRRPGSVSTSAAGNSPAKAERQSIATGNPGVSRPAGAPVPAAAPAPASGSLRVGEYACYGSGGRILAGFGFKVLAGGRYADLDATRSGAYAVEGDTVKFRGGHLDGTVGRALQKHNFRIGAQASCEPF